MPKCEEDERELAEKMQAEAMKRFPEGANQLDMYAREEYDDATFDLAMACALERLKKKQKLSEGIALHADHDQSSHGSWSSGSGSTVEIGGRSVKITYAPDDDPRLTKIDAAGIYDKEKDEVVIAERHRGKEHLINHELGHAAYSHIQNTEWAHVFKERKDAFDQFLSTSTARSYQQRKGSFSGDKYDPSGYDWVEAAADLHMERKAGKLDDSHELLAVMDELAKDNSSRINLHADHDQSSHGSWATGTSAAFESATETLRKFAATAKNERRISIDARTGEHIIDTEGETQNKGTLEETEGVGWGDNMKKFLDTPEVIDIHTHPRNASFSAGDIGVFANYSNIKEMHVVTPNGDLHTIRRTSEFDALPRSKKNGAYVQKRFDELDKEMWESSPSGEDADQYIDRVNKALASELGLEIKITPAKK